MFFPMVNNMSVNGKMAEKMVKEYILGKAGTNTKVIF